MNTLANTLEAVLTGHATIKELIDALNMEIECLEAEEAYFEAGEPF